MARILVLLAALLVAGCSATRFAYNNADAFLRWQATRYLDVEGAQSEELDARIAAFVAGHRENALPEYARLATEARKRLARGLSREDLVWGYDSAQTQLREALRAGAGEISGLLDQMTPEQIEHVERRFAEGNRKFAREYLSGTAEERRRRRLNRNLERLEEWFGGLSDVQVERVRQYSERAPFTEGLRDRERKRLQVEFIAMLRTRTARAGLADWAAHWDRGRDAAHAAVVRAQLNEYFRMLLDLDKTLTAEQRQAAETRFRDMATEFEQLSRK